MRKALAVISCFVMIAAGMSFPTHAQQQASNLSYVAGLRVAANYAWRGLVVAGNTGTGSQTITIGYNTTLPDGRQNLPFGIFLPGGTPVLTPVSIDMGASNETVTPTAVSYVSCPLTGQFGPQISCISFTGSFSFAHGLNTTVASGSLGLQEAINDAFFNGGGGVVIDQAWTSSGGTNAMITAAIPFGNIVIVDNRNGIVRYWNPTPTGAALAVPTTLTGQTACDATHQFCSDATVAGSASYAGGALFGCVAYVDIMGNEGPCSLSATFTDVSAKAIDVQAPVASPGAVGYVVYLSLDAGTYAQAYQIPSTATNCTLTKLETILPACAVTNTTYGQVGSTFGALSTGLFTTGGSQITTIALNTGFHFTKLGSVAMTAASLTPISNSSITYVYTPANHVGLPGISSANVVNYAASGSSATTIPNAIATWTIPANAFNFIGAEFTVSGKFTFTDGGDSSTKVLVAWDAPLSNSTTIPTTLCSMLDTATGTAAAYNGTWSCTIKTATTGATGTALVNGYANLKLAAGATTLVRDTTDIAVAPSAATVNWTSPARVVVYFIGTGATNNPGAQGLAATISAQN